MARDTLRDPFSPFNPPDDVTAGEWFYLLDRYDATEAEERRARIGATLKRLVRKRHNRTQLHGALMLGIKQWDAHRDVQMRRTNTRKWNDNVARARRYVDRALASLRQLVVPGATISDDHLFAMRHRLLVSCELPPPKRSRGGRPWEWKQETDKNPADGCLPCIVARPHLSASNQEATR